MTELFQSPSDLEGYLFRITDNGGTSADRYTVVFSDGSYLALSSSPSHPCGVSLWGEDLDIQGLSERVESGEEIDLALGDLDPSLVKHIIFRNNEGLEDFLETVEAKKPETVSSNRDGATENDGTSRSVGVGIYMSADGYMVKLDDLESDRGPYATAREAVLATLPDVYGLAGPEYHSTVDVASMEPTPGVKEKLLELEAKVNEEPAQRL